MWACEQRHKRGLHKKIHVKWYRSSILVYSHAMKNEARTEKEPETRIPIPALWSASASLERFSHRYGVVTKTRVSPSPGKHSPYVYSPFQRLFVWKQAGICDAKAKRDEDKKRCCSPVERWCKIRSWCVFVVVCFDGGTRSNTPAKNEHGDAIGFNLAVRFPFLELGSVELPDGEGLFSSRRCSSFVCLLGFVFCWTWVSSLI